jgi:type IV pilus assembly protein PilE
MTITTTRSSAGGFSLVELLVAVTIAGVLTAIVLPQYSSYVIRSRLTEAFTALSGVQLTAEQNWSNTRTYAGTTLPTATVNFTYALTTGTASAYKVTATGIGKMDGFVLTIDQAGNRTTSGVPSGWTTSTTCWVDKKDGTCTQ